MARADAARSKSAWRSCARCSQRDPDDATSWFTLGRALFDLARWREAIEAFHHALARNPRYTAAHRDLGRALLEAGEVAEAARVLRSAQDLARETGDLQTGREMETFLRRAEKILGVPRETESAPPTRISRRARQARREPRGEGALPARLRALRERPPRRGDRALRAGAAPRSRARDRMERALARLSPEGRSRGRDRGRPPADRARARRRALPHEPLHPLSAPRHDPRGGRGEGDRHADPDEATSAGQAMTQIKSLGLSPELHAYLVAHGAARRPRARVARARRRARSARSRSCRWRPSRARCSRCSCA